MRYITIAGKEMPLAFTMGAWIEIEESFGGLEQLSEAVDTKPASTVCKLIGILMRGGAEQTGAEEKPTDEWVRAHISPGQVREIQPQLLDTITEGLTTQTELGGDEDDGDVVLAELRAKKNRPRKTSRAAK